MRVIVEFLAPPPRMTEYAAGGDVLQRRHCRQHANQLEGAGNAFLATLLAPVPEIASP